MPNRRAMRACVSLSTEAATAFAIARNVSLPGYCNSSDATEHDRNSDTISSVRARCVRLRRSSMPIPVARTINSRNSGEIATTALFRQGGATVLRKYNVLSEVLPVNCRACAMPAGAQIAQCGGATHEPCSVQTLVTPVVA